MLAKSFSYGIQGLDVYPVIIEVDVSRGLPCTTIVGLPDSAIKESKERVRSAMANSGFKMSPRRVTINLSPADTKKEGPSFDLGIAVALLVCGEHLPESVLDKFAMCGELSLDGSVLPVKGVLSMALEHRKYPEKGLIVPSANAEEAALVQDVRVYAVSTLEDAVDLLRNPDNHTPYEPRLPRNIPQESALNFSDVKGQFQAKRGLEIAAAGGHNVLMVGPPGSGKSMLAKRFPSILPPLTFQEALEITQIYSVVGHQKSLDKLMSERPFRSPHHTTSDIALVGGGSTPRPGEITLSHNGVLFLDELPEFQRNALESLRQPLEDGCVTVSRANHAAKFPARFILIAAMNPCHCGWLTDAKRPCQCTSKQVQRYLSKISGPLLDRFDIHLNVPALSIKNYFSSVPSEKSQTIRERTLRARQVQSERFQSDAIHVNAQMPPKLLKIHCRLSEECASLLKNAMTTLQLSARAHDKILKISRTIADLAESEDIDIEHLTEAIQYRSLDRDWWG